MLKNRDISGTRRYETHTLVTVRGTTFFRSPRYVILIPMPVSKLSFDDILALDTGVIAQAFSVTCFHITTLRPFVVTLVFMALG